MAGKRSTGDNRHKPGVLENQRVGVFVDVQNMFYSAKYLYQAKLNFASLLEYIVRGRQLVRAVAYIVQSPDHDQSGFIAALKNIGYEVKSKELRQRADGSAKGDWDMGLAIDAISIGPRLDVVALVSGDGDFSDLMNMLKASGLKAEAYSFPGSTSDLLIEAASEYHPIEERFLIK